MKPIVGYILLGVASFLLFLVSLAPATLLADQFSRRLSGFSAQTVDGSAARGSMSNINWHGVRIQRLNWRWRPLALLVGRLEFNLRADDPELLLAGNAALGFNQRLQLRDLEGQLPVAGLAKAAGKWPLEGVAEIKLPALELNAAGRPLAARGIVRLLNLRASLAQPLNLGDYQIQLANSADGIGGQIKDVNAPLAVEGNLNLAPDGRYRLNGQVSLRETGNAALRQALSVLGPPGGDGRWALNFSGALAP